VEYVAELSALCSHPIAVTEWPAEPEIVERVPLRSCATGAGRGRNFLGWLLGARCGSRLLLDGDPARAEPKTQRWLLHVAARLTRGQRRLWVRTQETWPRAAQLAAGLRPAPRSARPDRLTWPQTPRDNAG